MAIEQRTDNSWRVSFPDPATGWKPPARKSFPDAQSARNFEALWKLRQQQGRLGEIWAEVFPAEAERQRQAQTVLLGDFLVDDAFPHWERTPGRGRSGPKEKRAVEQMRDAVMNHVFEARYERDDKGRPRRTASGSRVVEAWGSDALAWTPLTELDPRAALAFDRYLEAKLVGDPPKPLGKEVRRKVLSFLQQSFDHAVVVYPELYGRPNPFAFVKKPAQSGVRTVRGFKPDVVEVMRCDWRIIELLSDLRIRGLVKPGQAKLLRELGWPIPERPYLARFSGAFISGLAYGSARPQELLAIPQTAPDGNRLTVDRHNVDGTIKPGTKSSRYPRKRALLIGPGAADLIGWRESLNASMPVRPMLLFPAADGRPWNLDAYRNWRSRYYKPVALRNGLRDDPLPDPDDDDAGEAPGSPRPYGLRHVYATLRFAAHHDTLAVERSMGTSLAREVYAEVIEDYEARGVLDIDAEVAAARAAAPAVSATAFRGDARKAGLDSGLIESIVGTLFAALAKTA